MSLVVNQNLMAVNAARGLGNSFASLADSGNRTGNDAGLRQITRAEIKPLDSADAQQPAAAPETETASGAQGASAGASETQASPMAPEQQTGSILNITDAGLGSINMQAQRGMQALNFKTPGNGLAEMLNRPAQSAVKILGNSMTDFSIDVLSPRFSATEPLLNHIPTASTSVDKDVEALRSLFNVNG